VKRKWRIIVIFNVNLLDVIIFVSCGDHHHRRHHHHRRRRRRHHPED
jgi:hypothetical protein